MLPPEHDVRVMLVSRLWVVPGARDEALKTLRSGDLDAFRIPGEGWREAA